MGPFGGHRECTSRGPRPVRVPGTCHLINNTIVPKKPEDPARTRQRSIRGRPVGKCIRPENECRSVGRDKPAGRAPGTVPGCVPFKYSRADVACVCARGGGASLAVYTLKFHITDNFICRSPRGMFTVLLAFTSGRPRLG